MIKIIFCAFNEAKNLPKLLNDINYELRSLKGNFEVIACLDGGSDNSAEILQSFNQYFPVSILPQINQRGLGIAYKRIFTEIIKNSNDDDLIISLDADNTHHPKQITEMLQFFKENNLDFLVASRFCQNSKMNQFPLYRQLISKSTSIILQILFPIKKISKQNLKDYTSGYRIYKVEKLKELHASKKENFITEPEFTYTCELLIKLSRTNIRCDEIAIAYDYEQKNGASKLRIMRNFWRLIVMIIKLRFV